MLFPACALRKWSSADGFFLKMVRKKSSFHQGVDVCLPLNLRLGMNVLFDGELSVSTLLQDTG